MLKLNSSEIPTLLPEIAHQLLFPLYEYFSFFHLQIFGDRRTEQNAEWQYKLTPNVAYTISAFSIHI